MRLSRSVIAAFGFAVSASVAAPANTSAAASAVATSNPNQMVLQLRQFGGTAAVAPVLQYDSPAACVAAMNDALQHNASNGMLGGWCSDRKTGATTYRCVQVKSRLECRYP